MCLVLYSPYLPKARFYGSCDAAARLRDLSAGSRIDRVTIFRSSPESAWSIYAYGDELSPEVTNALELNERGSLRLWADLEAAYAFIRKSGFRPMIEIDG